MTEKNFVHIFNDELWDHEGRVMNKDGTLHILYKCPAGFLTFGPGINIDPRSGNGFPDPIVNVFRDWFRHEQVQKPLENYFGDLWWSWSEARKVALLDVVWHLGWPSFSHPKTGFVKTLAALKNEDYEEAAKELLDSKGYGHNEHKGVRARAQKNAERIRTGVL